MSEKTRDLSEKYFDVAVTEAMKEYREQEFGNIPSEETLKEKYGSVNLDNRILERLEDQQCKKSNRVKKAVSMVLVLFILTGGILISVPRVRASFLDALLRWRDGFLQIHYQQEENSTVAILKYVPNGYNLIVEEEGIIIYGNDEDDQIVLEYTSSNNTELYLDNEYTEIESIRINGDNAYTAIPIENREGSCVTWKHNDYIIIINATNMSKKEIVKIAEGVDIKK